MTKDETMVAAFEFGRFSEYLYQSSEILMRNVNTCSAGNTTKSDLLRVTREMCKNIIKYAELTDANILAHTVRGNMIVEEEE